MSIGNIAISFWSGKETLISNNIFVTLFLGCMVVSLFDMKNTNKEKIKLPDITCSPTDNSILIVCGICGVASDSRFY